MPTRFIFLILPQIHLLDLAGPDQTIHEAIDFGADFEMVYCGIGEAVESSAGLPFGKLQHFSEVQVHPGDYIIVPGARVKYLLSAEFKSQKTLFDWLTESHKNKAAIVSICAGAFVLAKAGLLNNISCTTHFQLTQQLQSLYPQARVRENILFVEDNNIYTSAGIASGIDVLLHIIEKHTSSYFTHKVAKELVIYMRRDGISEQHSAFLKFRNHIHYGVHKVQDHIIEHLHQKNSLADLAEVACMSERNLSRIFKKETGSTINEFITLIRKEKIQSLLQSPDLSKKQIAAKVGLDSEKQVNRILQS